MTRPDRKNPLVVTVFGRKMTGLELLFLLMQALTYVSLGLLALSICIYLMSL
jgi:hypothetical protein